VSAAAPTMLEPDAAQLRDFVEALFRYADPAGFVSLRAFDQKDRGKPPVLIEAVPLGEDPAGIVARAAAAARRAANAPRPAVFAPPVCTFATDRTARAADVQNGVALSVDIDEGDPAVARAKLESILGPVTIAVASGGIWTDPATGELHDKCHLHWRLAEPTAMEQDHDRLREARWLAAALVGADPSGAPLPHPLRWPGSWNTKAAPRLARIVTLNAEAEIHLEDAAERLAEAVEAAGFGKRAKGAPARPGVPQAPVTDVAAALAVIPNKDLHWDDWNRMGMAAWRATGGATEGLAAWEAWSAKSPKHHGQACLERWTHYATSPPHKLGAGTIFHLARAHGWTGRGKLRVVEGGRGAEDPSSPAPEAAEQGGGGGPGEAPAQDVPDCPVTPLGTRDGMFWFFDPKGQLRALNPTQMANRGHIDALLCASIAWAAAAHPAFDKEGNPTGDYQVKAVSRDLMRQCSEAGLFRDDEPRRGPGVWRDADGVPVLHLGNVVITMKDEKRERRDAGFRAGGALWPAFPAIRPPAKPATAADAHILEALFARWNWGGQPHHHVFFGLWVAGLLGAAIHWRPHGLVVGPPGSGKTTLMELYTAVSPLAEFVNDYTEAGLRQALSGRAAPLLLDEAEGDAEGVNRLQKVIELLRRASGGRGAQVLRGSAGGSSQRFEVMSPALLGAVLPPTLLPQDASRITRMDLQARDPNGPGLPDAADIAWARKAAAGLWGRALAGLPRFVANFAVLRAQLLARGCVMRLVDQLGTILAARAMMLQDTALDPAEADEAIGAVAWLALSEAEQAVDGGPAACLTHLLQSPLEVTWNGARPTVGACIQRAAKPDGDRDREALQEHGMRVHHGPPPKHEPGWLYIADKHPRLARLFEGTQWAGGRWREDLRRLPGAVTPENPQRIGHAKPRCTLLPPALMPEDDAPPPATLTTLKAIAEEYGMTDGWLVAALELRWTAEAARRNAAGTAGPR
jgi:hypothetical protein